MYATVIYVLFCEHQTAQCSKNYRNFEVVMNKQHRYRVSVANVIWYEEICEFSL